jgi:hypothetical protein
MSASPEDTEEQNAVCLSDGPIKGDIAIKKGYIYYIKNDGLHRMRIDGSDMQLLFSGDLGEHISVSGSWVYFTINDNGLYRIPRDGGVSQLLQKGNIRGRFVVLGSWGYYASDEGLCRMYEDGSYVRILVPDPSASLINVTEGHVYFTKGDTNDLHRSWDDGDNQEKFDIFDKEVIHVADGKIYSKDRDKMNYFVMNIDRTKLNRSKMDLRHENFHAIEHIDTADGWIFYDVGNDLFRMRTDGTDTEQLLNGTEEGIRKAVDDHLYYIKDKKLFSRQIHLSR